jgi:predicted signal transduction protein with EAL and GGDEF domain
MMIARLGGDEFAIIAPSVSSVVELMSLARSVVALVENPLVVGNAIVGFGVGIGIAVAPNDGDEATVLLKRADRALYRAKASGPSTIRLYEAEMDMLVERRNQIEQELREAIASDKIVPYYQPLVSLDGNQIIGFEALARWESKTLGHVSPDVLIRIAEETGLIRPLSARLFQHACTEAKNRPENFILAFNLSPVSFRDPGLGLRILSLLSQTGFDPRRLEIEITESAIMENADVPAR